MIEDHWDGIEAYCHEDNKGALGFVEDLSNKIRTIQRSAYGFRDEDYLRLTKSDVLRRGTNRHFCLLVADFARLL